MTLACPILAREQYNKATLYSVCWTAFEHML
jgi:hypothetical protein